MAGFGRRAHKQTHENNSGGIKMFSYCIKLENFKLIEDIDWITVS